MELTKREFLQQYVIRAAGRGGLPGTGAEIYVKDGCRALDEIEEVLLLDRVDKSTRDLYDTIKADIDNVARLERNEPGPCSFGRYTVKYIGDGQHAVIDDLAPNAVAKDQPHGHILLRTNNGAWPVRIAADALNASWRGINTHKPGGIVGTGPQQPVQEIAP